MKWVITYFEDTNPPLFYNSTTEPHWTTFANATVFNDRDMQLPLGAKGWEEFDKWRLENPDDMEFGFDLTDT